MLNLVMPALPKAIANQIRDIRKAKELIEDQKDLINSTQHDIAFEMHKASKGETTERLPFNMQNCIRHREDYKPLLSE